MSWDMVYKVHIEEVHSFLQHFQIYSFQIDFRILHKLRGVCRTIPNIYDAGTLQGSKYGSAASFFNISPLPLRLDT